jgi:transcriptional regulator with XRE-family HTH domain
MSQGKGKRIPHDDIRAYAKKNWGLSQRQIADRLGVSISTISNALSEWGGNRSRERRERQRPALRVEPLDTENEDEAVLDRAAWACAKHLEDLQRNHKHGHGELRFKQDVRVPARFPTGPGVGPSSQAAACADA